MSTLDTDDPTLARQEALAAWIGKELCGSRMKLKPTHHHSGFHVPPCLSLDDLVDVWADERVCDMAWWPVARALGSGALDHAWSFGPDTRPREPWGFVTEPYWGEEQARGAVACAARMTSEWGVGFLVLPSARSTWNPDSCAVIIAYGQPGFWREFISHAMRWLFAENRSECDE
jgi:hypothetical protein